MNQTNVAAIATTFDIAQKVSLPFVIIPCGLILLLAYKHGRARLRGKETIDSRIINVYSAVAGGMLGIFFFHTLPNSTIQVLTSNYSIMSVFIFLGFFTMLCIQKCARVTNENEYYTSPTPAAQEIRHVIDAETVTQNDYYEASELDTPAFSVDMWELTDETKEIKRRKTVGFVFFLVLVFESILEGFFLVYNADIVLGGIPVLILMFYINRLIQTFILAIVMIHGMYHVNGEKIRSNMFFMMSLVWLTTCGISTVPVLIDMEKYTALLVLSNPWTSFIYATAGGILFWIALYFVWIDRKYTNKRDTIIRLILFAAVAMLTFMTGFFI
jgi:zinc transporter ZupT